MLKMQPIYLPYPKSRKAKNKDIGCGLYFHKYKD